MLIIKVIFMFQDAQKIWKSIRYAARGLCHAYATDKSFRMEVNYGLLIYLVLGWYLAPFQVWEFLLFVFSYLFILVVELINTAFETMINHLHPHEHAIIGKSKDIASAAVLLAFLFALIVVSMLFCLRISDSPRILLYWPFA